MAGNFTLEEIFLFKFFDVLITVFIDAVTWAWAGALRKLK